MSHDQNFKNLILDYPQQAIELFAPEEAEGLRDPAVRILPVREEQLKERLGERFRELDTPVLVEWPDQRREALLFLFEEDTQARRFSVHRLIHYCVDISELLNIQRLVPVVIFLHGRLRKQPFTLSGDAGDYLWFRYLPYAFRRQRAADYYASDNLIARLNLPNMRYPSARRVEVYAQAVRGLLTLEPDRDRQLKYLDFIDIYAHLSEDECMTYQQQYASDAATVSGFAQRFVQQGIKQGIEQGIDRGRIEGESTLLARQLRKRFGLLDDATQARLREANIEQLERWGEQFVEAQTLAEVFGESDS